MDEYTLWRDIADQFSRLCSSPIDVGGIRRDKGWELTSKDTSPESLSAVNQFGAVAFRAGLARGAETGRALDAWLDFVVSQMPHYFTKNRGWSIERRSIAVSRIDPPNPAGTKNRRRVTQCGKCQAVTDGKVRQCPLCGSTTIRLLSGRNVPYPFRDVGPESVRLPRGRVSAFGDAVDDSCQVANAKRRLPRKRIALIVEPRGDRYQVLGGRLGDTAENEVFCEVHRPLITQLCRASVDVSNDLANRSLAEQQAALDRAAEPIPTAQPSSGPADPEHRSCYEPKAVEPHAGHVFRRMASGIWEVAYGGQRTAMVPHCAGMTVIQRLLCRPGEPISAHELLRQNSVGANLSGPGVEDHGIRAAELSRGDPVFDAKATEACKRELNALHTEESNALELGDRERANQLHEQQLQIAEALQQSRGLRGRARRLGDESERVRKAASKLYSTALRRLKNALPELGDHLLRSIRSGKTFIYSPGSDISWRT